MDFSPPLTISFAASARVELDEIWQWNADRYGVDHAADYIAFLQDGIDVLATTPEASKVVEGFPDLRALVLRRGHRGHGHVVVFRVDEVRRRIRVLHIYHTAQDIYGRLLDEFG